MRVLVTGASGFVGRALCRELHAQGHEVVAASRLGGAVSSGAVPAVVPSLDGATDWRAALAGCEAVVHLAARVHVMSETESDAAAAFRAVNTDGTLNLARQAVEAGVRRFVFTSSIKVNGEGRATPYREHDQPRPEEPYAASKWEAELGLQRIAAESGLETVIFRPPLVYGPEVRANFMAMMKLVAAGWPLPLAAVHNRRSLIGLDNLVDAIQLALTHPAAAGKTYLVSDGEDVSTPQLIARLAEAMCRSARLFPVPQSLLRLIGVVSGRRRQIDRLLGSLAVDSSLIRGELGWEPPCSLDEGLRKTVAWFEASTKL